MPQQDAAARAELLASSAAAERRQAQELIDGFIAAARERGLDPQPLVAQAGGRRVKTDREGWYLRRNHTLAVGTDGGLYVLSVASPSLRERISGVRLVATEPSLTVGRGGRDGESGPLREFLDRALTGL